MRRGRSARHGDVGVAVRAGREPGERLGAVRAVEVDSAEKRGEIGLEGAGADREDGGVVRGQVGRRAGPLEDGGRGLGAAAADATVRAGGDGGRVEELEPGAAQVQEDVRLHVDGEADAGRGVSRGDVAAAHERVEAALVGGRGELGGVQGRAPVGRRGRVERGARADEPASESNGSEATISTYRQTTQNGDDCDATRPTRMPMFANGKRRRAASQGGPGAQAARGSAARFLRTQARRRSTRNTVSGYAGTHARVRAFSPKGNVGAQYVSPEKSTTAPRATSGRAARSARRNSSGVAWTTTS